MGPQLWTTQPELMTEIMGMTGEMQTWSQGELTMNKGRWVDRNYVPMMENVPATEAGPFGEAMKSVMGEQTSVQKETLEVLKSIDSKLGDGTELPERSSGNTDQ